jgi:predicted transposase YdaD
MPDGRLTNRYDYEVVRLWEEEPELYLTAGVGLVPLAPLTNVSEVDLPEVVRRMAERINAEPRERAAKLWTATFLLMGLRYSDEMTIQLLEGVQTMRESTTYQWILNEGRNEGLKEGRNEGLKEGRNEGLKEGRNEGLKAGRDEGLIEGRVTEAQRLLVLLGDARLGAPSEAMLTAIKATRDVERLEMLTRRLLDANVHDWQGLLGVS